MQTSTVVASLLCFVLPIGIGAWIGTRLRRPWPAFFLGLISAPLLGFVFALFFALTASQSNNAGWLILLELPFVGILMGLVSGIVAAVIVRRRGPVATPVRP
jgi:hypothetical protein